MSIDKCMPSSVLCSLVCAMWPSPAKQNIDQMIRDIHKYHQTGLFPHDIRDTWDSLLSSFPVVYGCLPSPQPEWILSEFELVNERRTTEPIPVIPDAILQRSNVAKQIMKVNNCFSFV